MRKQIGLFTCSVIVLVGAAEISRASDQKSRPLSTRFETKVKSESQHIEEIREGFISLQAKSAGPNGKLHRGTHAKGVCASAEFEVSSMSELDPQTASRLKQGIFAVSGTYPAQIRFANADGKILPDQEPDVRAASFSVLMPEELAGPQGKMDFAMNDSPTFPINDAVVFGNLMTIVKDGPFYGFLHAGPIGFWNVLQAKKLGDAQKRPPTQGYQKLRYWSDVPFALGPNEAVKYSLKPCVANMSQPLTNDPMTLSNELRRHLSEDSPGCFDFQVQLLNAKKMTDPDGYLRSEQDWVENATLEWPEEQAPFYTVARLNLKRDPEVTAEECEDWKIDVIANSNPTHQGLGSINRARASAERASAKARQQ